MVRLIEVPLYDIISDIRQNRDANLIRLEKNYLLRHAPPYVSKKKVFQFICASDFKNSLKKLMDAGRVQVAAALVVMLSTGRRMVDCERIKSASIIRRSMGLFDAIIPRDKSHSVPINFIIDLKLIPQDWRPNSLENMNIWFSQLIEHFDAPFCGGRGSNLGRFLKYNPHQVRSIASINFSMAGFSDQEVISRIGWVPDKSRAMLRRYRKVEVDFGKQENLSDCLKKMNSALARAGVKNL